MLRVTSRYLFVLSLCAALLSGCESKPEPTKTNAPATPRPMEAATPTATPAPQETPTEMKKLANGLEYQDLILGKGPHPLFGQCRQQCRRHRADVGGARHREDAAPARRGR